MLNIILTTPNIEETGVVSVYIFPNVKLLVVALRLRRKAANREKEREIVKEGRGSERITSILLLHLASENK